MTAGMCARTVTDLDGATVQILPLPTDEVVTGQSKFPSDEIAFIDTHNIVLDHQPLCGASGLQVFAFLRWPIPSLMRLRVDRNIS